MKLYLKQIELGPLQNFVYLIGCPETRETAVIDPGWDVPAILDAAAQDEMRITKVLLTHTHFDHINGVPEVLKETGAQVLVHQKEARAVPVDAEKVIGLEEQDEIALGNFSLSLIHTPGHTPGSVCYRLEDRLLTGDTLFIGGCGRCDLPGGDPVAMQESLARLRKLDDKIVFYPGHNYGPEPFATLGTEKKRNPFLMAPTPQDFINLIGGVRRGT